MIIIIIFRFYRKEKTSKQIIEYQKTIVELKNKEILDSINYAKRIQQAIIPSTIEINQLFPNNFVMLLPRDIVSGDFYWIGSNMDHTYIALADCTGHGVPGGFMSMLGTALLNEIIIERKIYEPADILDLLKLKIIMDQFGGEKGKKFKYKKLEELLVRIREKDMEEQLTILKDVLSDWKGDLDQVDDICILGIKI